jgi:DNA-binding transcriptional ArsR family regulator
MGAMLDTDGAASVLAALAHATRLSVFRTLIRAGSGGVTAGELASGAGISPSNMTFHLKELASAGLVQSWREGRQIRYAVRIEEVRGLITFLTEECCEGRPDLCGDLDRGAEAAASC